MKRPGPHFNYIMPVLLVTAGLLVTVGKCELDRVREMQGKRPAIESSRLVSPTPVADKPIRSSNNQVKPTIVHAPVIEERPQVTKAVSPEPTPAFRPYPAYEEVFAGLKTRDWYYHEYNASNTLEHDYNDHRKRGFDPDDIHALPLLRLKKGHVLKFERESAFVNIRKIVDRTEDVFQMAFMRGEAFPLSELPHAPLDTPVCIIRLHKKNVKHHSFGNFAVETSDIIEPQPGIRGIQILSQPQYEYIGYEKQGHQITSVECVVRESDRDQELYKKLSLIHLSATLGIHCEIFKR